MPIPKIIHQTFKSADLPFITRWQISRFKKKNADYLYEFYDDLRIEQFLVEEYDADTLSLYKRINIGAAKADFFRYAVLYKKGGIYIDIDSAIIGKLNDFIKAEDSAILSKEKNPGLYVQWALIYQANHPFLKKTLALIFDNIRTNKYPHDVHQMTGPKVYSDAIKQCLVENPSISYRILGTDYNDHLKFKYPLSKLLYKKGEHWRQQQLTQSVLKKKMKITGFTFIRNAIQNDYPINEAIRSILPICDDFIVALGNSNDDTEALIKSIAPDKIKIIHTIWDESLKEGGQVFAEETNKALAAISKDTDWMFYIQGDECIHEKYLEVIRKEMADNLTNTKVEALLLKYKHFYGSYDYFAESRRWYRREVRILKNLPGIHSYKDAQGFRINNRKLNVKLIDAHIYHYGWVKTPAGLQGKVRNFNQFYQTEKWIEQNFPVQQVFDMNNADRLVKFNETHPAVICDRINTSNWKFDQDITKIKPKMNFRRRLLQIIEDLTGRRLFEYRNYKL
ncbi:hypothetical protein AAKU52_000474 [Pedobacter sp. CG_S7]|uniref:glycosyltransferase n=1 Tax=Pedobacter sp. CG_S7 TaxID=3143930 RepID=UPI003397759C